MANPITFRAYGQSSGADSDSCVIVKPVGLAVGDLMLAHCVGMTAGEQGAHTAPSGWTEIYQNYTNTQPFNSLWWKITDATDVAAADFTFTITGATSNGGAIMAFYGDYNPTAPIYKYSGEHTGNNTAVTAPTIDTLINCMLILFVSLAGNYTVSAYAIANENPIWTERYDLPIDLTLDLGLSVATALRTHSQPTGTGTATLATADNNIGNLVAIAPALAPAVFRNTGRLLALGQL